MTFQKIISVTALCLSLSPLTSLATDNAPATTTTTPSTPTQQPKAEAKTETKTTEWTIEGMHCSSCKKMVQAKVCKNKDLAEQFSKCEVEVIDEKKEIGKITLQMKDGSQPNFETINKAVSSAGKYKLQK